MIDRYSKREITEIWTHKNKLGHWLTVELAVIKARVDLGRIPNDIFIEIRDSTHGKVDDAFVTAWLAREKIVDHDLAAFVDCIRDLLSPKVQRRFHDEMTSYDDEEPAFARMLTSSISVVFGSVARLRETLKKKIREYRFLPMLGRTHSRTAEMQSLGSRFIKWLAPIELAEKKLQKASEWLALSKLSGAIGTNSGIDCELEEKALAILGLKPFTGASQIMPRAIYTPVADALADLASECEKIGVDLRLGTRDPLPIWEEPFKRQQKGSSVMPHKKNPIASERLCGMARMARQYAAGIKENIVTWEERAIEQSSLERVFWPDLFHVVINAIETLAKVIDGLVIYKENILREIAFSRGTYAASKAKDLLAEWLAPQGIEVEDVYRIVQLAARYSAETANIGITGIERLFHNPADADTHVQAVLKKPFPTLVSIETILQEGALHGSNSMPDITADTIDGWNKALRAVFESRRYRETWAEIFRPSYWLRNEAPQFEKILGSKL